MKKFFLSILSISLILFCGFKRVEKPFAVVSSGNITKENLERYERYFNVGQRINYALIAPDGVKYSGIRMQVSKQSDKTTNWGFSIVESKSIFIPKGQNTYYIDYIVPREGGNYAIQFFYANKKNYPFARREFVVQ